MVDVTLVLTLTFDFLGVHMTNVVVGHVWEGQKQSVANVGICKRKTRLRLTLEVLVVMVGVTAGKRHTHGQTLGEQRFASKTTYDAPLWSA